MNQVAATTDPGLSSMSLLRAAGGVNGGLLHVPVDERKEHNGKGWKRAETDLGN